MPKRVEKFFGFFWQKIINFRKSRIRDSGISGNLSITQVNGENLAFKEGSFDIVTIAFGLRNITDKQTALSSIYQTLRKKQFWQNLRYFFFCLNFFLNRNKFAQFTRVQITLFFWKIPLSYNGLTYILSSRHLIECTVERI